MKSTLFVAGSFAWGATALLHERDGGGVQITTLSKDVNATGGTGQVAAAGTLDPFGGIGVGCGINWNSNDSYGGGLQAGSQAFGLGGGYTITPGNLSVGAGIGLNTVNESASISFSAATDGTFEFSFESSTQTVCTTGTAADGKFKISCRTVG